MEQGRLTGWSRVALIALGILYAVTGLYLFMYPGINEYTLGLVMGIYLIVYGIVKVISYFGSGMYKPFFKYEIVIGVLMVIFGIILCTNVYGSMNFLGILTGIALLVDSVVRIYFSIEFKKAGVSGWWAILLMAIITAVCACFFLFYPSQSGLMLTVLVGAMFLSIGFENLFLGIFAY